MRKALDVAWREFRHTVMTKAFVIAAVVVPAVIWTLAIALPVLLRAPTPPLKGTLALFDADGRFAEAARIELEPARMSAERDARLAELEALLEGPLPGPFADALRRELDDLRSAPMPAIALEVAADPSELESAKASAREGRLLGVARFDPEALTLEVEHNRYELFLSAELIRKHAELIKAALSRAVVRARAGAQGVDLAQAERVVAAPKVVSITLTETGEAKDNEIAQVLVPLAFMLLMWTSTMVTGNHLLTSTIEEKSSRVVEVLLSAVSPLELLGGKILGQCLVGFLLLALYGGVGTAAASQTGYAHLVTGAKLGYLALYFVIAYFTVAAAMAAVGSAVNELREAQPLLQPIMVLFMIPLFAWFFISDNPNSPFATALSFIPPFVPFTMVLRLSAVEPVPTWQIVASSLVGIASVIALVWMSARIFRIGILMTGKAPSLVELAKWVRYR